MSINYENILYPEEAVDAYKENLIDIYIESYGEEYTDLIKERINNAFYFFDDNPVDTIETLYDYAKNDLSLMKRMTDEAYDYIECQNEALNEFGKTHIELLSKAFNTRREIRKLLDLDLSFLIDKSLSKDEYNKYDEEYKIKCKEIGVNPVYDTFTIKLLLNSQENLYRYTDLYVLTESIWGKRIINKFKEKFDITTNQILGIINSVSSFAVAVTVQGVSRDDKGLESILYFPLVYLLKIGDIDHCFLHEARHVVEMKNNGCGLSPSKGDYEFINEIHTEYNTTKDLEKLKEKIIWSREKGNYSNAYQKLFPYVLDFFERYGNIHNDLAINNNIELFEKIFGSDNLYNLELFINELYQIMIISNGKFYIDEGKLVGKRLIKILDENADRYFSKYMGEL